MNTKPVENPDHRGAAYLVDLVLKAVPLAMGVAVTVTSILGGLDVKQGFAMLGIGMACIGIHLLNKQ